MATTDEMPLPTRDEFIAAARNLHERSSNGPFDAETQGQVYDLLVGPPEAFISALAEWAPAFLARMEETDHD